MQNYYFLGKEMIILFGYYLPHNNGKRRHLPSNNNIFRGFKIIVTTQHQMKKDRKMNNVKYSIYYEQIK